MFSISLLAVVLIAQAPPEAGTDVETREITATLVDEQPKAEAPPPMAEPPPLEVVVPVFEVGATMMSTTKGQFVGGPTFRCTLRHRDFLISASLDWPIGTVAGRTLLLAGAGLTRSPHPKVRLYGLGLLGVDAVNGPPVQLHPTAGLRFGGEWLVAKAYLSSAGVSMTLAYDLPYAWNAKEGPTRGFTFWAAATGTFTVVR